MTESGHGAQVVQVLPDHTYFLDDQELESVLMREEIKDLPVVMVSVAGAFRKGKSFLLNFFLRYLTSPPSARADGSWLGDESEPLVGFSWRSGSKRNTTGILLWSEPILMALASGEKVAVLLMDTQGTFDSESTVRDCSTIFALSTLLSSVQIYNLSSNIQEDDLQHLQLFTEYGRVLKDKEGSKAFQVLEFLVRDWSFSDEYDYGCAGGELFLQEKLTIKDNQPQEMKDLRTHIASCFEKVSCFLMPHPGLIVTGKSFTGKISDINPDFKVYMKELVSSLFGPEKLMPKSVNGQLVRARELCTYFKTYMGLFNSNERPDTMNIVEATMRAGMLAAVSDARAYYEANMEKDCGVNQPSVPAYDLQDLHDKYLAMARAKFTAKKKMGTAQQANSYLEILTKEINTELPLYRQSNVAKIQATIDRANKAYDAEIEKVKRGKPLCVHPSDLLQLHSQALAAALKLFDDNRRHVSNKEDMEREEFKQGLDMRLTSLRKDNIQNHNKITTDIRLEYYEHMQQLCNKEPPLSSVQLKHEHEDALKKALQQFHEHRNRPDQYSEDVIEYELTQEIMKTYVSMKKLNESKNKMAVESGKAAYKEYMSNAWPHATQFLHPLDFEAEHSQGRCRALDAFRPHAGCSVDYDPNNPDKQTLLDLIDQDYRDMKKVNESRNQAAAEDAYKYYYHRMEELCRPIEHTCSTDHKSGDDKAKFHNQTKTEAVNKFMEKRRYSSHSEDYHKSNLVQRMNNAYNEHMKNM